MKNLHYLPKSASTMDSVLDYYCQKESFLVALYTLNQTAGRGQYGNSWESTAQKNIAISFMVEKARILASLSLFNFYTATIIRRSIAKLTHKEVKIKWPNDLILDGKKVGGILIEARKQNSTDLLIVGVGINVLQENFDNMPKAASLFTQTGISLDPHAVARQIFTDFQCSLTHAKSSDEILDEYSRFLFRKNEVSCFMLAQKRQNGIIKYADADGFLWIDLENDGLRKFFHKEIELLY